MRPMPPRRLRTLIIGLAMFILGPVLGFVTYIAVLLRTLAPGQVTPPFREALAHLQQIPGRVVIALLPLGLGAVCGAAGLVLVLATLATHFLGQESILPKVDRTKQLTSAGAMTPAWGPWTVEKAASQRRQ
jgi:hypothetical protein